MKWLLRGALPVPGQRRAWGGGAKGKTAKDVESVPRLESSLSQQQVLKAIADGAGDVVTETFTPGSK